MGCSTRCPLPLSWFCTSHSSVEGGVGVGVPQDSRSLEVLTVQQKSHSLAPKAPKSGSPSIPNQDLAGLPASDLMNDMSPCATCTCPHLTGKETPSGSLNPAAPLPGQNKLF